MKQRATPGRERREAHGALHSRLAAVRFAFGFLERVAPRLAGRLALALFRTPRRHRTPPRELAWRRQASRSVLEADGQRLAVWSWGHGPIVLLAHGWEGRASQMGGFVAPLVERGYRVVAVDAPAHGASPGRRSSVIQFAAALRSVAGALGEVHGIVAHSFGAAAVSWALRGGLAARRLVFIAPPGDLEEYLQLFVRLFGVGEASRARMLQRMERRFGVDWEEIRYATVRPVPRGSALLVVQDRVDAESPLVNAAAVVAAWPGSRLYLTEGLGHRRILRDPEVIAVAADFLAEGEQSVGGGLGQGDG